MMLKLIILLLSCQLTVDAFKLSKEVLSTQSFSSSNFSIKSLSIVIQRSYSQAFLNKEIHDSVQNALNSLDNDYPNYFSTFILTTFVKVLVGKDSEIRIQKFTNSSDFIIALNPANIKYAITTDQKQRSFDALLQTLKVPEVENEHNRLIFLFIDSPPKNSSLIDEIKKIALRQSIPLNIFISALFGSDGTGQCMELKYFDLYKDLSHTTSGLFFNLCDSYSTDLIRNVIINIFN